jgi:O-methyltransferase
MSDLQSRYLELLRRNLTRYGVDEMVPVQASRHPVLRPALRVLGRRNIHLVRERPFDERKRDLGLDSMPRSVS